MILENKLNITNPAELGREEEKISKKKAKEMFETVFLDKLEVRDMLHLKQVNYRIEKLRYKNLNFFA